MATGVTTALWRATRDQQSATLARQLMAQADAVRPTDPATALRLGLAAAAVHPADDTLLSASRADHHDPFRGRGRGGAAVRR